MLERSSAIIKISAVTDFELTTYIQKNSLKVSEFKIDVRIFVSVGL